MSEKRKRVYGLVISILTDALRGRPRATICQIAERIVSGLEDENIFTDSPSDVPGPQEADCFSELEKNHEERLDAVEKLIFMEDRVEKKNEDYNVLSILADRTDNHDHQFEIIKPHIDALGKKLLEVEMKIDTLSKQNQRLDALEKKYNFLYGEVEVNHTEFLHNLDHTVKEQGDKLDALEKTLDGISHFYEWTKLVDGKLDVLEKNFNELLSPDPARAIGGTVICDWIVFEAKVKELIEHIQAVRFEELEDKVEKKLGQVDRLNSLLSEALNEVEALSEIEKKVKQLEEKSDLMIREEARIAIKEMADYFCSYAIHKEMLEERDQRLDALEKKLEDLNTWCRDNNHAVGERLNDHDHKVEELEKKVDGTKDGLMDLLTGYVNSLLSEMKLSQGVASSRISALEKKFKAAEKP